jgi:hypothetical protein
MVAYILNEVWTLHPFNGTAVTAPPSNWKVN